MNILDLDLNAWTNVTLIEKVRIANEIIRYLFGKKIIIYGAGAVGKSLQECLRKQFIQLDCFIDKEYQNIKYVNNIEVRAPETLSKISSDNTVIIIAINAGVIRKINDIVYENIEKYNLSLPILPDGAQLAYILNFITCKKAVDEGESLNLVHCLNCSAESKSCEIYEGYLRSIAIKQKKRSIAKPSKKFDWFGYIMGQYCTLKCQHCCEHVPYIKNPEFISTEILLRDCKKVADASEFLRYIELIGGEPFLHPDFVNVLKGLLQIENIGYVKTFTNGTVVPSDELCEILCDKRIVINFSNYTAQVGGALLENIYTTMEKFKQYGIDYIFSTSKLWTDWGDFHLRNKTEENLKRDFKNCFCADCHRLFKGILYRCPHQYAGIIQDKMLLIEGEYIAVHEMSSDELARSLDAFEELEYTDGCRRCDMPYDCPVVPAGIQLKK